MNYRLILCSVLLLAGCRLGERTPAAAPTTPETPARTEPGVRVGLAVDTPTIVLTSNTTAHILDRMGRRAGEISANQRLTLTAAGSRVRVETIEGGARELELPIRLQPAGTGRLMVGEKPYRGELLVVRAGDNGITVVNVLDMEEYLLGVVPYEIGRLPASQIEAMKAQAIAARTYAIGAMGSRNALGFDFYATVADQVYGGLAGEDSIVSRAVRETRGEIITYEGKPIIAYYSSTCGGRTAAVAEVWPWRTGREYLKSRSDMMPDGKTAYCATSNRYRWNVSWSGDSLRHVLEHTFARRLNNPDFRINEVEDVRVMGTTPSGRAEALAITLDATTYRVPADSIRWVLRPTIERGLNSSLLFEVKATQNDGEVTRLDVHGGGWGHGIGMCQVGAINRAKAGQSYREILTAYYTDVEISRLY